jgi:hypothetical protein
MWLYRGGTGSGLPRSPISFGSGFDSRPRNKKRKTPKGVFSFGRESNRETVDISAWFLHPKDCSTFWFSGGKSMSSALGVSQNITQASIIRSLRRTEFGHPTVDNPPDPTVDADLGVLQMRSASLQDIAAFEARPAELQGYCKDCGEEIPEKRRRALPFAILCITCKEADDEAKKNAKRR